jgi:hypothetical protein
MLSMTTSAWNPMRPREGQRGNPYLLADLWGLIRPLGKPNQSKAHFAATNYIEARRHGLPSGVRRQDVVGPWGYWGLPAYTPINTGRLAGFGLRNAHPTAQGGWKVGEQPDSTARPPSCLGRLGPAHVSATENAPRYV